MLPDKASPRFFAIVFPCPVTGAIFQVSRKYFIARFQIKTFSDRIYSVGWISYIYNIVFVTMNIITQYLAGCFQVFQSVYSNKLYGFPLQFKLVLLVSFKYRFYTGAIRTKIEKSDILS